MNRITKIILALVVAFFVASYIMPYARDYIESIVIYRITSFTLVAILGIIIWKLLGKIPKSSTQATDAQPTRNDSDIIQFMFTEEVYVMSTLAAPVQVHSKVQNNQLIPEKTISQSGEELLLMTMQVSCRQGDSLEVQNFIRQQLEQIKPGQGSKVKFLEF